MLACDGMDKFLGTYGGLTCTLLQTSKAKPVALVVLCHGYGADGDDLVSLAQNLGERIDPGISVRFVCPHAPIRLGAPTGRAWWHLDIDALLQRQQDLAGYVRQIRAEAYPGLAGARKILRGALAQLLAEADLGYDRLILGGFSQGAMLATDVALRLDEAPAGLVVLSGTLTDEAVWRRYAMKRTGLPVVQSHGEQDPILPFYNAVALRTLFMDVGMPHDFIAFAGGHTIPAEAIAQTSKLIAGTLRLGGA
jgi:phospholipase/carboxylesterase